jgi:hypothetical protein
VAAGGWTQMASVRVAKAAVIDAMHFSPVVQPGVTGAALLAAFALAGEGEAVADFIRQSTADPVQAGPAASVQAGPVAQVRAGPVSQVHRGPVSHVHAEPVSQKE